MSEDAKDSSGLFRIKDLEAIELDEEEIFPIGPDDAGASGLVSEDAAEEMVAAIRRARQDVTGPQESLDELIGLARATDETEAEDEGDEAGPTLPEVREQRSVTVFQTDETKAVIEAAEGEMRRRRLRMAVLLMGVPIVLLGITLIVVWTVLSNQENVSSATFPVGEVTTQGVESPLAVVGMIAVPEPEPTVDEDAQREREREEQRERRRRRREREREEPAVDRSNLF